MGFFDDIKILTNQKITPVTPPAPKPVKKILIVEDEKQLANVLEDRLKGEGFDVKKAANGEEGLEQLKIYKPDMLLLDLLMPIMNGREMLYQLREIPEFKNLPVIVLTNAGEVENIRITRTYHDAIEFLIKSNVTLDEIVGKIKRLVW